MQPRPRQVVNCPHCSAVNPSQESLCRACSRDLTVYIGPAERLPRRFGVGSLMILVACVGIGLGFFRAVPLLGGAILVLVPAALVRTMAAMSQRAGDGRPMSGDERVSTFFNSIGVMLAVAIAAFIGFGLVMVLVGTAAANAAGMGMRVPIGIAGTVGLVAGGLLMRRLWPYKG